MHISKIVLNGRSCANHANERELSNSGREQRKEKVGFVQRERKRKRFHHPESREMRASKW